MTRKSKANHFDNFFQENKLNLFKTWEGIRKIINITTKGIKEINCIQIGNKTINNRTKIANNFKNHFTSIAEKIEDNLVKSKFNYSKYLSNPNEYSFFMKPTNAEEVLCEITKLENNKSIGPCSIPLKFLKLFKTTLSEPISLIANVSFSTGTFPSTLKTANVIPIYKKEDHTLRNNYRPISLLSNISKIIEKLVHIRRTKFLNKYGILYEKQFGFRNNHSTAHALLEITEKIKQVCDTGQFACGVFLDLQKAFDTVNHTILLKKLTHYGIRGVANKWFQSFLEDRKQFTSVLGIKSAEKPIKYGVPQGSVLGPLLFILFINDLHKAAEFSSARHFANDTNLLLIVKSLKKINKHINRDLELTVDWIRANKLSLNASKTEIVLFKPRNKKITKQLNFRVSGQEIKQSSQVRYLGVILQDDMQWDAHITNLEKKLSRSIGLLSKIRYYVPMHLLQTIYYSIFNSHLIYACEIWGQNQNSLRFTKVTKLQNKALKVINFQSSDSPTGPLYQRNKVLKIADFISYKNALFVRNTLKKEKPQVFHEMFIVLNQNHTYNTRAATYHFLDILQVKTTHFGQYSVKFQASETWNNLQRTQNLDLLTSELLKKHCSRHTLPNTAITSRAIYYLLYIPIFDLLSCH